MAKVKSKGRVYDYKRIQFPLTTKQRKYLERRKYEDGGTFTKYIHEALDMAMERYNKRKAELAKRVKV